MRSYNLDLYSNDKMEGRRDNIDQLLSLTQKLFTRIFKIWPAGLAPLPRACVKVARTSYATKRVKQFLGHDQSGYSTPRSQISVL